MKHVEDFITERRNFKDYIKYNDMIKDKYHHETLNNIDKVTLYKEGGIIFIEMIVWNCIIDYYIDTYKKDMGDRGDIRYVVYSKNGRQMNLFIQGVSEEFLEKLELEYNTKKYNL